MSWFLDRDSPDSWFSLHRVAVTGVSYHKKIGEWFGPSTTASVIRYALDTVNVDAA